MEYMNEQVTGWLNEGVSAERAEAATMESPSASCVGNCAFSVWSQYSIILGFYDWYLTTSR